MSIFGQVWLWSLAAFFVGVLLTWLVLVLPLRKSVRKLESALAQAHADAVRTPANAAGLAAPGTEVFARPESSFEERSYEENSYEERSYDERPQETSYPGTLVAAPPMSRDDVHEDIDADFAELDSRVPSRTPPEADHQPEPEDRYEATTTQYLAPVAEPDTDGDDPYRAAAGEYLSPEEAEGAEEPFEPEAAPALSQLEQQLEPNPGGSLFRPSGEPQTPQTSQTPEPDWFDHEPQPDRSAFEEPVERTRYIGEHPGSVRREEPAEEEAPQYAFAGDDAAAGGELDVPPETPAEATQVLPKRQPRVAAVRGGFDAPEPIQPSMRTVERRDPDLSGAHSGSLFEPSVQPNQTAVTTTEPPPAPPARESAGDSVPPGPFGPGSAMPRPGGGAPSDAFAVKASVTALRYCTEESAQFPKMVAEVWFRTAEDAERVGFRPLT